MNEEGAADAADDSRERLTRAQHLALALDRNLSVTAGAGTGKTRVLTKRLLEILALGSKKDVLGAHPGVRASQVVAVTFTRKAASEMRERVTKGVTRKVREAQEAGDEAAYAFWVQVRRELEEATIQTIHGLAARLVRLSALELGIDPRFRIVEGIDARLLLEDAVAGVLTDPPEESLRMLQELYVLRGARDVRGIIRSLVTDRVHADGWAEWMIEHGVQGAMDWLWEHLVPVDEADVETRVAQATRIHEALVDRVKSPPPEDTKAHRFLQVLADCAGTLEEGHRGRTRALWRLMTCCTSGKGEWYKRANDATGPAREWEAMGLPGENKTVYADLEEILRPLVGRLEGVPDGADEALLELLVALARVYQEVVDRYDGMKQRRGLLDYHDLEVQAKRALLRPGVAESLRHQVRYLLVDEFQDTNEDQWTIIRELARTPVDLVYSTEDRDLDPADEGDGEGSTGGWASAQELEDGVAPSRKGKLPQGGKTGHGDKILDEDEGPLRLVDLVERDPEENEEGLGEDRLFIVGDAKQSIYAFRGADVTVYEESREAVREANRSHGLDGVAPEVEGLSEADLQRLEKREREGEVALDRNFRSLPGLVRFTNQFFDRLLAPEDPDAGRQRYEAEPGPLTPHRQPLLDPDGKQTLGPVEGSVRVLATPYDLSTPVARGELSPEQADRLGRSRYQFARMVQDIKHRVEGPPQERFRVTAEETQSEDEGKWREAGYRDVAVLLPRKRNLRLLEEQFRLHGVPYVVVAGRGFWSKQEVYDAVGLLAVIAQPQRDVELFSVLRSAFFAWSDEALALLASLEGRTLWQRLCRIAEGKLDWDPPASFQGVRPEQVVASLRGWRARSRATSASRLLMQILSETPYLASLAAHEPESSGRLGVENLEKLVELVRELERRRGLSLAPLVRDLLSLAEEDEEEAEAVLPGEDEEGVRVMTVHAAKGLEFPVVYVAELDARLPGGSLGDARGVQSDRVMGVPMYALKARGEDGEPTDSLLNRTIRHRARLRSRAEYKRLLYVAATRAEDHLVLVGASERSGPKRTRRPPALKALEAGGCWMDWVEKILSLDAETYAQILEEPGRSRELLVEREGEEPARVTVDVGPVDLMEEPLRDQDPRVQVSPPSKQMIQAPQAVALAPALPPAPAAAVRVSPSQLLVYAVCQARFRYRVLERATEGWARAVDLLTPDYGETFGSLLHRALAHGARPQRPVPDPVQRRALALAERHRTAGWPSATKVLKDLEEHAKRALSTLEQELQSAVLLESKVDVEFEAEDGRGRLRVVGRLDRVHRDREGRLVVIDLKTDTVQAGDEEQHAVAHGHAAQVLLYDEALQQAGFETGPPGLLYSATGRLVRVGPEHAQGMLEGVKEKIGRSQAQVSDHLEGPDLEAIWPKTARFMEICRRCGFWSGKGGPCGGIDAARTDGS